MKKIISYLLGFLLLGVILYRLDLAKFKEIFFEADLFWLIFGFSFTLLIMFIRTWRWNYLKKAQNINYSLKDSFLMLGAGLLAGFLTPGRLGEFSKLIYLKNDGYSYSQGAVGVILDRFLDVVFLLFYLGLGAWIFMKDLRGAILTIGLSLLVIIFLPFLLKKIFGTNPFGSLFSHLACLLPGKYQKLCGEGFKSFFDNLRILKFKNYLVLGVFTVLLWTVYFTQMFVFSKSLNIQISFFYLAFAVTAAGIITMIPISFSGIGTRDLILIAFFSFVLLSGESAVALSTLILGTHIVAALIGWFCWLKKPLLFK